MVKAKAILFIVGIIATLASIIGLAISFNMTSGIFRIFPSDLRIYFGACLLAGLIALGSLFNRNMGF